MSIIDDIKADREAGTGGDWVHDYETFDNGWTLDTEGENTYTGIGPKCDDQSKTPIAIVAVESAWGLDELLNANARRIARVPQLEAIVLAADKVVEAALAEVDAFCVLEDSHQIATRRELEDALDQFREASND